MRLTVTSLCVLGLLISSSASAEDAANPMPDIPKPLKVMPVKIKPVQSSTDELSKAAPDNQGSGEPVDNAHLEMLTPRANYGFPADFWKNSNRKQIVDFLSGTDTKIDNRVIRDIALRATLTPAPDLSSSDNAGENLYALRLQRLVNMGDFHDGMILYKMNEDTPPTPLAARVGLESILGNGDIAVACLEQKALDASIKTNSPETWVNVDGLCQALLSPAAGTDDTLRLINATRVYAETHKLPQTVTAANFNKTDIVAAITLIKTNRIGAILTNYDALNALTDNKIGLLLSYIDATSPAKIAVLAVAIKRGMITGSDAIDALSKIDIATKPVAKTKTKTKVQPETNPYATFLTEYRLQTPPLVTARLLELADTPVKQDLLIPLYEARETSIPAVNQLLSLKLLIAANQPIPANLVRGVLSLPESPLNSVDSGEKLLFSHLLSTTPESDKTKYPVLLALNPAFEPTNVNKIAYDNILNLTLSGNYVMPNGEILSSLKKSAEQKQIDQVVVTSLKILTDTPVEKTHPAALYQIFEAFNSAGLTEETLSLARSVLGTLFEKK